MYCTNCGKQIDDKADICVGCGKKVDASIKNAEKDSRSVGWWWLGFFFPLIGFILWAVWTGSAPIKSKRLLSGTIVGIVAAIVGVILYYVLFIILMFSIAY